MAVRDTSRRRWRVWLAAALTAVAVGGGVYTALPGSAAVSTWRSVAAGGGHTCAVKTDRTLWCWGLNTYGQLGIGNTTSKKSPTKVGTDTTWDTVAAGQNHTCALRTNGVRLCWGYGAGGMLGLNNDNSRTTPGRVRDEFAWKAGSLTAGGLHTCGIRASNNAAYCWGANPYGALGQGGVGNRNRPFPVLGGQTWVSVSAGDLQTCGVNSAGTRFCWGAAELNQLGLNRLVSQWEPTMLNGDTISYGFVELGGGSGCALQSSPTRMRCWGTNEYGHAGTGSAAMAPAPVPVTTRAYTSLSSGGAHACAVAGTGTLYCWGQNGSGQLGLNNTTFKRSPTAVTGMPAGAMTLSAGQAHTCAIRSSDSTLYCWGSNTYGQVGIGSTTAKILVPTQLA